MITTILDMIPKVILAMGMLSVVPILFGFFLLLLFIVYAVALGWLSLFPIFSWHFNIMSKVWLAGLSIITNGTLWKLAGIGALLLFISSFFI